MSIPGLSIIGESINDSVPSTRLLFESEDFGGLKELAIRQEEGGAAYIDVNVGPRSCDFMQKLVREIQSVVTRPLSIDSPDLTLARAGLEMVDLSHGLPILNSISPLRVEMFDLYREVRFRPILLISEQEQGGERRPTRTAQETYETGRFMLGLAKEAGIPVEDCLFDPGIAPIGMDSEGNLKRLLDSLVLMQNDPEFRGSHVSVGLSNFTVMLPPKRTDGSPVKGPLESAFLTRAVPLGLDFIIGSIRRSYNLLEPDDPAMQCLSDCLERGGFESIMRVREFYV
ncbi:MAG: dihydropteroate synthase [Thermoguttaceae bacterium]